MTLRARTNADLAQLYGQSVLSLLTLALNEVAELARRNEYSPALVLLQGRINGARESAIACLLALAQEEEVCAGGCGIPLVVPHQRDYWETPEGKMCALCYRKRPLVVGP